MNKSISIMKTYKAFIPEVIFFRIKNKEKVKKYRSLELSFFVCGYIRFYFYVREIIKIW